MRMLRELSFEQNQTFAVEVKRVVVAVADDALRTSVVQTLSEDGYQVVEMEDGWELHDYLEMAVLGHSRIRVPDVIVADSELPGMSGVDVHRWLQKHDGSIPMVFLASGTDAAAHEEAHRLGGAYVFNKPVPLELLSDALCFLTEI